jgi:sugar phosphate isomerase/epimerase
MTPRFSLAHLTVLGCTPAEATHIAAETGYDCVSFRLIALGLPGEPVYALHQDKAALRETKAALASTGLTLQDIEVARISDDREVRDYAPALETAAELGARHVLASGFGASPGRIADQFVQLCALARPLGLTVDMEFMPFSDIKDLQQAYTLVTAGGQDNAGILIDTLHFDRSPSTLAQLDAMPKHFFHFAQLNDAPHLTAPTVEQMLYTARNERLYLGEGEIPIREIMARLPGVPCSLEIAHVRRQQELGYKEFARQCLLHARRYFES